MSKAIEGAAMLAGAVGLGAVAFLMASSGVGFAALPYLLSASVGLGLGGVAMEAGAIADALTSNRGMNISTRQPAANRQIIYGTQRVGGTIVWQSTTGSHKDQYNFIIAIAGHVCWSIVNLYLDGRQVYFQNSGPGFSIRNGVYFGGAADGNDHTGPNGITYNFGGKVYCEARYGDQAAGDVIGGMTANDPNWAASADGSPYMGGCTYVYLKIEYDEGTFPQLPEIKFTVRGKPIYDPRDGLVAYTDNWALVANDIITDPTDGMGDPSVNQAQLIAAANVCDEQVAVQAIGGFESRYTCHMHYDTGTSPGDALANMMDGAAGRLSRIGGEWYIWPAYWQGPSFTFDHTALTGPVKWSPNRSFADLVNRVNGTYVAPNYPYAVAGNYYDGNGWANGMIENNWPFAFQPTNFPQYACDPLHGYANDQYLDEDSGVQGTWSSGVTYAAGAVVAYAFTWNGATRYQVFQSLQNANLNNPPYVGGALNSAWWANASVALPMQLSLGTVLSITQAQRVAKIKLLRNRQQGSGTLPMGLAAYGMQPCDVMNFTFPLFGWSGKTLEISGSTFQVEHGDGDHGPAMKASFEVQETSQTIYEWDPATEERTVYDVPASTRGVPSTVAPPTSMSITSSAATALVQPDGSLLPRIEATWTTPQDAYVTQIRMRYRVSGAPAWSDGGLVDVALNYGFIFPVIAGQSYDVAIQSVRANGATSVWVEQDGLTAGFVLSTVNQTGIGQESLLGEAYSDGTAGIFCEPFTALLGNRSVSYFPASYLISGLVQQQKYYVYVVDLTLSGGSLTPVATQDTSDFTGKAGYYLIGTVTTPYCATTGGSTGARYYPSSYQDLGTRTTISPDAAYDGDSSTAAVVSGSTLRTTTAAGDCIFQGDPAVSLSGTSTLKVVASALVGGAGGSVDISATVNGTTVSLLSATSTTALATYTCTVPAGTPLNTITVEVIATPAIVPLTGTTGNAAAFVSVSIFDTYVQS